MPRSMSGDQDGSLSRSGSQIGSLQGGPTQPNLLGRSFSEFCSSIALSVREVRHQQHSCLCAGKGFSGVGLLQQGGSHGLQLKTGSRGGLHASNCFGQLQRAVQQHHS